MDLTAPHCPTAKFSFFHFPIHPPGLRDSCWTPCLVFMFLVSSGHLLPYFFCEVCNNLQAAWLRACPPGLQVFPEVVVVLSVKAELHYFVLLLQSNHVGRLSLCTALYAPYSYKTAWVSQKFAWKFPHAAPLSYFFFPTRRQTCLQDSQLKDEAESQQLTLTRMDAQKKNIAGGSSDPKWKDRSMDERDGSSLLDELKVIMLWD